MPPASAISMPRRRRRYPAVHQFPGPRRTVARCRLPAGQPVLSSGGVRQRRAGVRPGQQCRLRRAFPAVAACADRQLAARGRGLSFQHAAARRSYQQKVLAAWAEPDQALPADMSDPTPPGRSGARADQAASQAACSSVGTHKGAPTGKGANPGGLRAASIHGLYPHGWPARRARRQSAVHSTPIVPCPCGWR